MDRLTQLQECVDKVHAARVERAGQAQPQLSKMLFVATGALQRDAPLVPTNPELPVTLWTAEQVQANWEGNKELARTAAKDIAETAKVIDFLIEQLPGIERTEEEQIRVLRELEEENRRAGEEMEQAIAEAEQLSGELKGLLRAVADGAAQRTQ
ncbi:hypothetical protein HK105_207624 [Polyrhizophydium stewartii]|uniref:Mediator of RNA polymerase II transcription subunit 21 n=1 Tax=Polyrhizophydium stewartii TaxID=2732419 RepID=A0ABR4N040_9FUNG